MDRFRPAAGGCVYLQTGNEGWTLCLLPTRTADPQKVLASLDEIPTPPASVIVLNWWDDGFYAPSAVADRLELPDDRIYLVDATAPADRAHGFDTGRVLARPTRIEGKLELGTLRIERAANTTHGLLARWSDSERTVLIGAALPLDAWTRSVRPRHLVGTLRPPESPAEQRALDKKIEAQLFDEVRTFDLLRDVVGPACDAFIEQLGPHLREADVRVRQF